MTNYNQMIDHTYLKADATIEDINKLLAEAVKFQFKTVCVNASWVPYAKTKLANTGVGITCVVGFPLGATLPQVKAFEAAEAIEAGASEIDMVINIGKLKDGDYSYVLEDIKTVKAAMPNNILKVIVETALLNKSEIEKVTQIVIDSGAEFIKTSTGFASRGASLEDIKIMKAIAGEKIQIKAAGGISNKDDMIKMIDAGANRFGTSRSIAIIKGKSSNEGY
ncbi:deoxyribose-phosphate aldolase [Mycoplasmopsis phocirhinis]|uniref:Deoxyribose-phosphate aldolase n=1 Tax=Mycoplasmopsis phocirhinis TaxID=142650 RepID=A0A4P6MTF1_9BACT|nr:deoxyribose-phosphate aldolase [Mycoplasmopsis phocirhinis]QBF34617.1 deoxyribose-phosphate aldolase [Mycoplasmopsis phocirhinis]